MVYHYSNFIWETNAWWLRRVRPVNLNKMKLNNINHIYTFEKSSYGYQLLQLMSSGQVIDMYFLEKFKLIGQNITEMKNCKEEQ